MKIAVIGSGVSGIGAVWALNEYSEHEVHLFESNEYLGGHTHTVQIESNSLDNWKPPRNVDTGFIVKSNFLCNCNIGFESNYIPEFSAFLENERNPDLGD